jgi:hypothetical protein
MAAKWDVNKILLPEGMEAELGKGIMQAVTDVVSLPGGYQSNTGNEEASLALFTHSMAKMPTLLGDQTSIGKQTCENPS